MLERMIISVLEPESSIVEPTPSGGATALA